MPRIKRTEGGQLGNQNARKHGYYSKVLDKDQKLDLKSAQIIEGLDDEIALLRAKIKSILRNDPDNIQLIIKATGLLVRLVRAKHKFDKENRKKGVREQITKVLKEVAIPMGLGIGATLKK